MKPTLTDALAELAAEAGMYADVDAAVERRRRRVRRVVAASAAAGVVAATTVGALAYLTVGRASHPRATEAPAAASSRASAGVAPRSVAVPAAPPALPGTGRVGAGSLLYAACHDGCQPLLLTQDGAQFQLEKTTPGPPTRAQTLSPDGRWMGQIERGRYVVRELAGVRRHELPGSWDAWAWSPEGRWLLLADHQDGDVRSYLRMDVASGRSTPLPPPAGSGPAYAVLGSGELLFGPPERFDDDGLTTAPITYQVFDPVRRAVVRSVRVDVRAALRGGEVVAAHAVRVAADGASLVVEVLEHRVDSVSRPTAVVTVSADGRVGRRLALPASGDGYALPGGVWSVERPVRDGLLLLHTSSTVTEVVLLDLRTGSMRPLFVLPANVPVTVPGRARY